MSVKSDLVPFVITFFAINNCSIIGCHFNAIMLDTVLQFLALLEGRHLLHLCDRPSRK
jgi:hypothetical protein